MSLKRTVKTRRQRRKIRRAVSKISREDYFLNLTSKAKGLSPWLSGKVSTYIAGHAKDMKTTLSNLEDSYIINISPHINLLLLGTVLLSSKRYAYIIYSVK